MENEFVQRMKQELLNQKKDIMQNLMNENAEFKEIIDDIAPKDLADVAADDIDKKNLEALSNQEMRRLRLIDAALARAENGKYGYCVKCSKKIPKERLEAIPYALMCINCKSSDERRNR